MITHTEFEKLKYHIELVANRETDSIDELEFSIDRDENEGISITLNPGAEGFDLEPEDEDDEM